MVCSPRYKKRSDLQDSAARRIWLAFSNSLFHSSIDTVSWVLSHEHVWCSCWLLKYFKYAEERHWGTGEQSRAMCAKNNLDIISSVNRQSSLITLKMYALEEPDCTWSYCADYAPSYFPSCILNSHINCKKSLSFAAHSVVKGRGLWKKNGPSPGKKKPTNQNQQQQQQQQQQSNNEDR